VGSYVLAEKNCESSYYNTAKQHVQKCRNSWLQTAKFVFHSTSTKKKTNIETSHRAVSPSGTVRMCSFCISSIVPMVSVLSLANAKLQNKKTIRSAFTTADQDHTRKYAANTHKSKLLHQPSLVRDIWNISKRHFRSAEQKNLLHVPRTD